MECDDDVNYMKAGIERANIVTTVSKTYAEEIKDTYYAYGLAGILNARDYKIRGVVNGIDVDVFNPATDKNLENDKGEDYIIYDVVADYIKYLCQDGNVINAADYN